MKWIVKELYDRDPLAEVMESHQVETFLHEFAELSGYEKMMRSNIMCAIYDEDAALAHSLGDSIDLVIYAIREEGVW